MRIVTIDYLANIPGSKKQIKGGPANFAKYFSAHAAKEGHSWIGIVQRMTSGRRVFLRKLGEKPNCEYVGCFLVSDRIEEFLHAKRTVDPCVYFEAEIDRLACFLEEQRADVVFLNGYSLFSWMVLRAAWKKQIPLVVQHAGILTIEVTLYKHLYSSAARKMLIEMERDTARYATKQVFLNEYSREVFQEQVAPLERARTQIIPLPYAETANASRPLTQVSVDPASSVRIGCVARWDRIKNHKAVLELAKEIERQKRPWSIESVTTVPPTNKFLAFKKAYQKRIRVTPPMDAEALRAFYRRMDVLILPSLFDVSPTVVMEAAHEGRLTLIAPQVGWVTEYRAHGLESCIVDFSNPVNVVKQLEQALLHTNIRPFQVYMEQHHAPREVFQAYIRLFTELHVYANRSTRLKLPTDRT